MVGSAININIRRIYGKTVNEHQRASGLFGNTQRVNLYNGVLEEDTTGMHCKTWKGLKV
jgi:hypothetical protein